MSAKTKDMRRPDLVVPYIEPPKDEGMGSGDVASSMSTMLPMAAIMTKNKVIGWVALIMALQGWLAETPDQKKTSSTPGYFGVGMAFMALMTVSLFTVYNHAFKYGADSFQVIYSAFHAAGARCQSSTRHVMTVLTSSSRQHIQLFLMPTRVHRRHK